ncbi:MAG: hypothetical protein ACM3NT_11925 [Methylocystaceae bacterium]
MVQERHYNLIFPLFITIFLPPFIIIPLVGNLLIDATIYYLFLRQMNTLPPFPKLIKMVLPAWVLGFIADIMGAALLIAASEILPLKLDLIGIWTNPITVLLVLLVIALVGWLIYRLNLWLLGRYQVNHEVSALVALAMSFITAPWFFLVPTTWFKAFMGT